MQHFTRKGYGGNHGLYILPSIVIMNNYVRVGVIGCGKIAQIRHIPEYAKNTDVKIVGFFDHVQERAEGMAAKYGGIAFPSIDALLTCDDIDAVSVCTANSTHKDITVAALRCGKHVLCEKPMAATVSECEEMAEVAQKEGKNLMIAHNQRFFGIHKRAKELLDSKEIGRPLTFRTTFGHSGPDNWSVDAGTSNWFFDKNKSAFGVVADLGVHKIDLMRYLFGCDVVALDAMLDVLDKKDASGNPVSVEDNAIMLCRMENGAMGTVTVSWTYYKEEDNDTAIYGSEGIMKLSVADRTITVIKKDGTQKKEILPPDKSSGVIDAFIHSIRANETPAVSAEDVIPSMRTVIAAIESARTEKRVKI